MILKKVLLMVGFMDKRSMMKQIELIVSVNNDWLPLSPACWSSCPWAPLIPLGSKCKAIEIYERDRTILCPFARNGYKVMKKGDL